MGFLQFECGLLLVQFIIYLIARKSSKRDVKNFCYLLEHSFYFAF